MLAPGNGRSNSSAGGGDSLNTFCTMAPRRMFLCDVPLFFKQINADADGSSNSGDGNLVRLMGTVVEVIQTTPLILSDNCTTNSHEVKNKTTCCMVHFVIDDGTALIGVFAKRRVSQKNNGIANAYDERFLPAEQTQPPTMQNANHPQNNMHADNQTLFGKVSLESILSAPQKPILVGQAVDCIGRIQADKHGAKANDGNGDEVPSPSPSSQTLWLAASSVSIVNNPQAVTLRQIELSSATPATWSNSNNNNTNSNINNTTTRRSNKPQNRILVGGELERKLNPLFHCTREGTVVFNMEDAFNYIKHSKDDGGITPSELALLVRAIEPSEKLAVNLAVGQLREDCRIYLNQGKWFPM